MRFLLHGNLTLAVAAALVRHGHTASTLADIQLETADLAEVLKQAQIKQLDLMTVDSQLAGAPFDQQLSFNRSIVFLQLEGADVEQDDAIDRLFERYKRLTPGRLYTVTGTRVKVRQLPGK